MTTAEEMRDCRNRRHFGKTKMTTPEKMALDRLTSETSRQRRNFPIWRKKIPNWRMFFLKFPNAGKIAPTLFPKFFITFFYKLLLGDFTGRWETSGCF